MAASPLAIRRHAHGLARRRAGRASASPAVIPYDHAASFTLTGSPGNVVPGVINVGVDGVFVATAIGYGLEEQRARDVTLTKIARKTFQLGEVSLGEIPPAALVNGFRLTPNQLATLDGTGDGAALLEQLFASESRDRVLQELLPPSEISFFFSIVDSNSGRELQDEPVHNVASLGKGNGERPFRLLPQPMSFAPRSTVRLQIIENTEGVRGTLFIVLYGYKILAPSYCPEPVVRSLRGTAECPIEMIGAPSDRLVPFDYVANIALEGRPQRLVQQDINVNVDGGFVATALGYAMSVEEQNVLLRAGIERLQASGAGLVTGNDVDLGQLPLSPFGLHLQEGVRIRPNMLRVALQDGGRLTPRLPLELADRIFEPLNRPEDVSFRYTIFDVSTGRELQNGLIHNVAGLGIANGDRPFKKFARPMIFFPRSAIRVVVQEHFGRGRLFLVFQGYKLPGSATRGVR